LKCFDTGWGRQVEKNPGSSSQFLMEVDLPIIPNSQCEEHYSGGRRPIVKKQICAGHPKGGMDTCQVI